MGLKASGRSLASLMIGGGGGGSGSGIGSKYGAISSPSLVPDPNPKSRRSASPLVGTSPRDRVRNYREWSEVEDDSEDDIEELVDVPYSTIIRNYALVPIVSLLFLVSLVVLFTLCWAPSNLPDDPPHAPYPYPPHIPELLVGAAAWIVSYSLRVPSFLITSSFLGLPLWLSTMLHVTLEEALRWGALILIGIRLGGSPCGEALCGEGDVVRILEPTTQDEAFRQVFWVAVGWAVVEVCWSVSQGYEQLALYRDVLPTSSPSAASALLPRWLANDPYPSDFSTSRISSDPASERPNLRLDVESISHRYVHSAITPDEPAFASSSYVDSKHPLPRINMSSLSMSTVRPTESRGNSNGNGGGGGGAVSGSERRLDEEMQLLINIQSRTELEAVFGVPPPNIPVFISILQRLDSILLTVGLTLLLSSSYLSQLSHATPTSSSPISTTTTFQHEYYEASIQTLPTFSILVVLHTCLSVMWTELLPRIGIHTASYVGLMVSLGVFFAGLAGWGALV
ncbi:hypothetical protein FRB95_013926 [Tulasnella sp. JGI-2019a]|nr:hypothetical protein FRB95_013926 [Tulasnella sp. JGI-2019a]